MSEPLKKHSRTEALKIIRRILKNGVVVPMGHLNERMKERGFEMRDVVEAIDKGAIYDEPEIHMMNPKYIRRPEDGIIRFVGKPWMTKSWI